MIPFLIGLSSGLLLIAVFVVLKRYDKPLIYGLVLTGIGFLYVGFTWSHLPSLVITSVQAIAFLLLAYYGIKQRIYILSLGFFLHGIWDLAYHSFDNRGLIPPKYEIFCLTIDFVIGIYLLIIGRTAGLSSKGPNL